MHRALMAGNDNVTALLYRRRNSGEKEAMAATLPARQIAFDPLLVFTAVLVAAAAVGQVFFLVMMEF